ncbi:MAG TPA: MipA/OmpV family protein [Sphingomicrobium sp.]|nr:MipA/OmpV family protein [Sphingomicrobium sp.]
MKGVACLALVAVLALPASPAQAEEESSRRFRVGLGAKFNPDYPGADGYRIGPLFDLSIAKGDEAFEFEAADDSFDIAFVSSNGFTAGPVLNIQGSRKESNVGAPVGKVATTIEAGGFAEFQVSEKIRLRGEVRKGIGGHDGVISSLGADYVWRDGDKYVFSLGPRVLLADSKYQRAYYGVSPQAALATGLPGYRPNGGIYAVAATSSLYRSLGPKWGMFGFARYERLMGDSRKSPIVREYGSVDQFSAGLGLTYTFTKRKRARLAGENAAD